MEVGGMSSKDQANIRDMLLRKTQKIKDPAGRDLDILEDREATKLAYEFKCEVRDIYLKALAQGIYPYRYIRNLETLSLQEQIRLANGRVAIVGAGGLGGQVVLLLARIGVGNLVVVDSDVFDETNLNRQALCAEAALNRPKSEQAVEVVAAINPGVQVSSYQVRLNASNAPEILTGSNVVVDALDNLPDRFVLEKAAKDLGIPLVHGALAGFEGQLMTIFPEDAGLKQIYGSIRKNEDKSTRPESILGVPAITPSLIATLQAMEVLKILLNRGKVFRNVMLHVDLENGELNRFMLGETD